MLVINKHKGVAEYIVTNKQEHPNNDTTCIKPPLHPKELDDFSYKQWLDTNVLYVNDIITNIVCKLVSDMDCSVHPNTPIFISKYVYRTSLNKKRRFHFLK